MPFIPLSYPEIVALTRKASERQPKAHFTQYEIEQVNENVERNPFLKAALNIYAPFKFNELRSKYYEEHRAIHQEMNVHDPVFEGARSKTRTWLQELPSSQPVYDKANLAAYKATLKQAFHTFVQQDGLKRRYPTEEGYQKAKEDFDQYFDKIFEVYQQGASHPETLMYYIQWCQAGDKQKMMLGKSEDQARFEDLFMVLDDSRNAYKDSPSKFYPGHDWSCPPGMEERLLDMLTSIRKAEQPDMSTAEAYVVQGVSPFISAESNRSLGAGLYAVYESLAQKEDRIVYTLRLREDAAFQVQVDNDVRGMVASSKEAFENYQTQILKIKEKAGTVDERVQQQLQIKERLALTADDSKQLSAQQRMSLMQLKGRLESSLVTYLDDKLKTVEEIHDDLQQKNPDWNEEQRQEEARKIVDAFESYQTGTAGVRTEIGVSELFLTAYPEIGELRAKIAPYCLTNEKRVFGSGEELFDKMKKQHLQSLRLLAGEGLEDLPESSLFATYQLFFEQESAEEVRAVQDEDGKLILLTEYGSRILNDSDCLLAIASKTGLTQDHMELLMSIPTSGDGLAEFKASLEAGKKPERTVEEALRECSETKEKLMTLARQYLQDYPGEHGVYLSWDDAILEDLKRYLEQRPEGLSLLLAQDKVLAEVVQRLGQDQRSIQLRNKIFEESAEAGYLETMRALLLQPGIDDLSKNIALKNAANRGHKEIVELLLRQSGITDDAKNKVLESAIPYGLKKEIVELLLAEPGISDKGKNEALKYAVFNGHKEIVELLLAQRGITAEAKGDALTDAATKGHKEILELLLRQPGITDDAKNVLLERAIPYGLKKEIVELLLAEPGISDKGKNEALKYAVFNGHKEIVELLLMQPGITDEAKNKALKEAAYYGDKEIVELLLRQPGITDDAKNWALKNATRNSHKEIVELLLGHSGITAEAKKEVLEWAAPRGHKEIVEILLAQPGITDDAKNWALKNAVYRGHKQIAELLLAQKGITVKAKNDALEEAARRGHKEMIELLLEQPGITEQAKNEALQYAVEKAHKDIVEILLAQPEIAEQAKNEAFKNAASRGHKEIAELLLAQTGITDESKNKALQRAISYACKEIVELLLAQPEIPEKAKNDALEEAAIRGHKEMIELLLEQPGITEQAKNEVLQYAASSGHKEILALMLRQPGISDDAKNEAFKNAASRGQKEIAEHLLAQPGITNDAKNEALQYAARLGYKEILALMLRQPGITDEAKNQALKDAVNAGHKEIAEHLLAQPGITNDAKNEALQYAASSGHKEILALMLRQPGITDEAKNQALKDAVYRGHTEIVELLETKEQTLSRSPLIFRTKFATLDSSSAPKSRTSGPA